MTIEQRLDRIEKLLHLDVIVTPDTLVHNLPLGVRALKCLSCAGLHDSTVRELQKMTDEALLNCHNLGRHTLLEIRAVAPYNP